GEMLLRRRKLCHPVVQTDVRRIVACIRVDQRSGALIIDAVERGDVVLVGAAQEKAVQPAEQLCRIFPQTGRLRDRALDHGGDERRRNAMAGNIAQEYADLSLFSKGDEIEKI